MTEMERPTWDQTRARLIAAEAERDTLARLSPHGEMLYRCGAGPASAICGECANLIDKNDYGQVAGHYFKCLQWIDLHPTAALGGPKTDWRKRWSACGRFVPKEQTT